MPTYDYECDACGHTFEVFQGINEPVKEKCPDCKKKKLRRLFGTGAAIVFKGSGFYQTDYRSESYKKAASADKSNDQPKNESKSDSKSEKKSAGGESKGRESNNRESKGGESKGGESKGGKAKPKE